MKKKVLTVLGSIAWALAIILPKLAWGLFSAVGWAFTAIGTGFIFLAGWFAKASDEPVEQAVWAGILLILVLLMFFYFGLPLLAYWPLLLVIIAVFAIAVLWALWRKRK